MSDRLWLSSDTQIVAAVAGLATQRVQFVDCSFGRIVVKGLRPARPAWRFAVLNALATLLRLPMLRAAPAPGGEAQQATEVRRLQALRAAGVPVPEVYWVGSDRFAMAYLSQWSLSHEWHANQSSADQQLALWQQGVFALLAVHARGQALSQAFARNALWVDGKVWFIDFEDDPLTVMSLDEAQARDWLAYLHSSVYILARNHSQLRQSMLLFLEQEMSRIRRHVSDFSLKSLQRVCFLRHLPSNRKVFGRDVVAAQALGSFVHDWLHAPNSAHH